MLHLRLGRGKSGKTTAIMEELRSLASKQGAYGVLLVPEQYSYEAETELLRFCGDSLSLHAEVLSFSRLASRVESELGFGSRRALDPGGRLLSLARALDAVGSRLQVFRAARRNSPLQQALLRQIDECKSARISPDILRSIQAEPGLQEKLNDLALVFEAYEAVAGASGLDPLDRLSLLAEALPRSEYASAEWFVDGFTDFTAQESAVLEVLLRAKASVTVCLSCPGLEESHEIFEPSRRAALRLRELAERVGAECRITAHASPDPVSPMQTVERELFSFGPVRADSRGCVALYRASSVSDECEAAAAGCIRLVRERGCRWRDIAVAARDFERYRPALETAFARYGVPLYAAKRSDMLSRPLPALIASAYAAVTRGWAFDDVMAYMKTDLSGLSAEECDTLEDYAFLWSLRGNAWSRQEDWVMHPNGFALEFDDASREALSKVNALRGKAMAPLWTLSERSAAAVTAAEQAEALAAFFDALALPEQLKARAATLAGAGLDQTAGEYVQLWELTVNALEQASAILGDAPMDAETFGNLFCLVLSAYDVGTIPMTLDRVGAGDMDRMRKRHIRHLIVLGCDSESLPAGGAESGLFSDADREALLAAGLELGDTAQSRLDREFALMYNCLTLPEETLALSWCSAGSEGAAAPPSFVVTRAAEIFQIAPRPVDTERCRENALRPAFELAAASWNSGGGNSAGLAARRWFLEHGSADALETLEQSAKLTRGRLSPTAVRALYGERTRLSASRIDRLASCGFSFFLEYGLRARPRQPAGFSPPELGSFMHYVLEQVSRAAAERGGFRAVPREEIPALCDRFVAQYVHEKLWDFRQKSPRFIYLFQRLEKSVRSVVTDMAEELRRGDFEPLDFELNFGDRNTFPPVSLGTGESTLTLTGVADRVDGWLHDGKLYLRVVDYKTGIKTFSLSDVWYGMGLQMLLYLFALQRSGGKRYRQRIVPAGVLYVPARDVLLSAPGRLSADQIVAEKAKRLRRSGLLLEDAQVLDAMERGAEKQYLPVRFKNGVPQGDSLASLERFGLLSRHIEETLADLAGELRSGSVAADPWYRSQTENACRFCDYQEACQFTEGDERVRCLERMRADEVWERLEKEGEQGDGV